MELILAIFLTLLIGLCEVESFQQLVTPTATSAEIFPYHAVIETDGWWCNGVIISDEYVLTRGSCIIQYPVPLKNGVVKLIDPFLVTYESHAFVPLTPQKGAPMREKYLLSLQCLMTMDKKSMVYLGFTGNPYIPSNQDNPAGQIFHAIAYHVHDEFGTILRNNQFINNLALIQLNKPLTKTPTVQPVEMASPDDYPIPAGTYVNVTGFPTLQDDLTLHYVTAQIRDIESCELYYGDSFLKMQEGCVRQKGAMRNRWAGPYVVNGILVGLQRSLHADAECFVSSPPCDVTDVFLTLESCLEWIFRISGVAGGEGNYFKYDNPYWHYRPDRIQRESVEKIKDTVIELEVNVQTCKQNENSFITALKKAIEKNQQKGIKKVLFEIDLF